MNDYFGYRFHRDRDREWTAEADAARLALAVRRAGRRTDGGVVRRLDHALPALGLASAGLVLLVLALR